MRKRAQSPGKALVMALPLAIGWTIYTAQPTPGNFLLAYVLSLVVIMATGQRGDNFRLRNLPLQLYNLIAYVLFLAKEVLVSGVKVALIVLAPELKISPGTTELSTFDDSRNELISAISAHGITITPGELVVDFKVANGE
ncbi:MAG: Na+/H+ antiporter subunit E, partial [Chloroflexota bacterium]|nr:Na+/H+ antiporter subunit E [Chloroflexota bacterium]